MNSRKYLDGDGVAIAPGPGVRLTVRLPGKETPEEVEPRRLFPVSDAGRYISLVDQDDNEKFIIRSAQKLDPESRRYLETALDRYYMIPRINKITDIQEKFGLLLWKVDTDRGPFEFHIQNRHSDIKVFSSRRILIRDSNDNRYEIPDYRELPGKSRNLLLGDL